MKKVILKSLTLCNFKGEKERTTNFNDDVTTISGGNGLGKSRHFEAFIWLLFGKDVQNRKDYEIRTRLADNSILHKVECSVTGVLDIDGEIITIKRESVEEWVKSKGEIEAHLDGTHNECWWNEAPVNVTQFNKRIAGIIDTNLFKMLTNPAFFVTMPWKYQRDELFRIAGTITDAEIAATKPEFATLLARLNNKSLADFKAEIKAKRERLKEELDKITPEINQTHKLMPESEDFAAIEAEIEKVDKQLADIDKILSDNAARIRAQYQAQQNAQKVVFDLKSQRDAIVADAKVEAQNAAIQSNAARRGDESLLSSKKRELKALEAVLVTLTSSKDRINHDIVTLDNEIKEERARWYREDEKPYQGDTVCSHCGQPLPEAMQAENLKRFNEEKQRVCDAIVVKGQGMGARLEAMQKQAADLERQRQDQITLIDACKREIADIEKRIAATPEVKAAEIVPEELPGYAEMTKRIEEAEKAVMTDATPVDDSQYQEQKRDLTKQRDDLKKRLAKRDDIARFTKEIADLEAEGKRLAQAIADLEKEEFVADDFQRTRIVECESRINSMFHHVNFKLFEYTYEGNEYETCVPLVDGVPWGSANTAAQVNAGLDIINTLCRFYGICAPIFFDNAESVNEYIHTESQCVFLRVTTDKTLVIK